MKKVNTLKFAGLAAVAVYSFWYASTPATGHLIDEVAALLGQFGGALTQCLGPVLLIGFFCWRKNFYFAALMGFWLGLNLLNISVTADDTLRLEVSFLTGTVLHLAGMTVLSLATLAGILFTREAITPPTPKTEPVAFGEEWLKQGRPAPAATPVYSSGGGSLSNATTILIFAAVGGAVALYNHGSSWLRFIPGTGAAARDAMPWPTDFVNAMNQAKTEHKPIMLSFTGSDWCSACQQLDESLLDTKAFRDYAAKNVVFVEVDMPHNKNQPAALVRQNEQLCQKYNIEGFPTVIIVSSAGKTIGSMVGAAPDSQVNEYFAGLKNYIEHSGPN